MLAKFLMGIMIARPNSVLNLPGIKKYSHEFALRKKEHNLVNHHVAEYLEAAAKHKPNLSDNEATSKAAFTCIIKAQKAAAHPRLLEIGTIAASDRLYYSATVEGTTNDKEVDVKTRNQWLALLQGPKFDHNSSRVDAFLKVFQYCRCVYPNEKILVFSEWVTKLDLLEHALAKQLGVECLRFDGTCSTTQRETALAAFKEGPTDIPLLITSMAGGVGLNLQYASIVIQTEVWWNHNWELQAWGRVYRKNQQSQVKIFRLFASNSAIDQIMLRKQQTKTRTIHEIMNHVVFPHTQKPVVPKI